MYDSYHKATALTIYNDASPLNKTIPIIPWCTLEEPLPYIAVSNHMVTTFAIWNNVSPLEYIPNIVRQQN